MIDMEKKIKVIHSQDAGLKVSPKKSGETSLNLSTEIMEFINESVAGIGETAISFLLYKNDFLKGLAYIIANLPLYKTDSKTSEKIDFTESYFNKLYFSIQEFFGDQSVKTYDVKIKRREDSRIYLNDLRMKAFSIRDFLIEEISVLIFSKDESGSNVIRLDILENLTKTEKEEVIEDVEYIEPFNPRQIIYYGAPGTGKSYKIKEQLKGVPKENIYRTTFHPDSDYSTFVGSYKPKLSKKPLYGLNGGLTVRLNDGKDLDEETITYSFNSQAFLNAYMEAYKKPDENVYLIIEEINRGNCAQIFGDLFQLLDRDENGVSEYTIKADADLNTFLRDELGKDSDAIKDGELSLPSNLYIYATMNTSDQSLFPIDSAFKRRWDWEYEPIKYKNTDWMIDIQGSRYSWVSFQKEINKRILESTSSEDKMLGDYFVNPNDGIITEKMLLNKILFYLWNDVCKDGEGDLFKTSKTEDVSFSDLHGDGGIEKLISMMGYLGVEKFEDVDIDIEVEEEDDDDSGSNSVKDRTKYSINGNGKYPKKKLAAELVKLYVAKNQSMSAQEVVDKWKSLGQFVSHFIETQAEFDKRTDKPRKEDIKIGSEFIYVSTNGWGGQGIMDKLINAIPKDWNLNVEKVQ